MSGLIDGKPDARAPGESAFVAPHGLDNHLARDAAHATELLDDARRLENTLRPQFDVLEVAATTPPRAGEWARWRQTMG